MRYSLFLFLLLAAATSFFACKKTDATDNPASQPPTATAVGIPVGSAVSKSIGAGGGTIASADGRVELVFPAGALNVNTNISIQPVTNTCPGGNGLSYHLMPDGINFNKPVNLIYHYTEAEMNGTLPYLLYIAYQDSARYWKADFKQRTVDTVAKTATLGITHFSIWSIGDRLRLFCTPAFESLYENETREIRAVLVDPVESSNDDLPPLPSATPLPANNLSNWKVNGHTGNNTDGTITPNGNTATYKAPGNIQQRRTVQVSVQANYQIVMYNNGRAVSSVNRLILFMNLTLLPATYEFTIVTHIKDNGVSGYIGQLYEDIATFDLTIQKTKDALGIPTVIVLATNFKNNAPTVTPVSQTYPNPIGTFTWTWTPDGVGETNITRVDLRTFNDSIVDLDFIHTGALTPGNTWSSTNPTLSGSIPSTPFSGIPAGVPLKLKAETQNFAPNQSGGFMIQAIPK